MTTFFGPSAHPDSPAIPASFALCIVATCTLSGNVNSTRLWVASTSSTVNAVAAIYATAASVPTTLLGSSNVLTLSSGIAAGLQTFTFAAPVAVTLGADYGIAFMSDAASTWNAGSDNLIGNTYYLKGATYPTFPSPLAGTTNTTRWFAHQAGVDAASGGGGGSGAFDRAFDVNFVPVGP